MPTARPLTPDEKKHVASLRALIGSAVFADVRQGVNLLHALRDTELFEVFADGVGCNANGTLQIGDEVQKRARAAFRTYVALSVLAASPDAASVAQLRVSDLAGPVDLRVFSALRVCVLYVDHAEPIEIGGLPALTMLGINGRGHVRLADLPALQDLSLRGPSPGLRLDAAPALATLTIDELASIEIPALPALTHATVTSCSAAVQQSLAVQPALAVVVLKHGDLDAWTGAPALKTLKGDWRNGERAMLPALETVEGHGPIPRGGAPRLREVSTKSDEVHLEDLPSLERLLLRTRDNPSVTLRRLPKLSGIERQYYYDDPVTCADQFERCSLFHIESVPLKGALRVIRNQSEDGVAQVVAKVVARDVPMLTSITTNGTVQLADLPHLQRVDFCGADRFPTFTGLPALRSVSCRGALTDVVEIARHTGLTSVSLGRHNAAPTTLDLTPLAQLNALETLDLDGISGSTLGPLKALHKLKTLTLGDHADLVDTVLALPAIESLRARSRVPAPGLRALLDHPTLVKIDVGWDIPAWVPRLPVHFDAASKATTREALDLLHAGVGREPTPPARKERAALAEARRILDENEPRKLLPLFASSGPDLARALCAGTSILSDGTLWIGAALTNATRVGVRGDTALLVADAAGLLDGVQALSLCDIQLYDLGVMRRHAKTLRHLDLQGCGACDHGVVHGDHLLRVLDAATPLDGDPTEPLIAPPVIDRLPLLLGAATEAEVMEGVSLAITTGRVPEGLNGCKVQSTTKAEPGPLLDASGAGEAVQTRAIRALLAALPAGAPVAREVTSALTRLEVADGAVAPWMRHAAALREIVVASADLPALLDLLPAPEAVTLLELRAADVDLSPVQRLTGLTTLKLAAAAIDLHGLERHPTIEQIDLSGEVAEPDTLAQLPALARIRVWGSVRVDRLCRVFGDRPITFRHDTDSPAVFTLG